ncbi:MAG: metallophosphoesterase [Lautropia sp.]
MRLAVFSDLHLEFEPFVPAPAARSADVVVLAGDIHNGVAALQWARRTFPEQPIVQIAGNHEFFGAQWQALLAELRREARTLGIHFLENDALVLDGVRFLGATLWTDFALYARPGRPLSMDAQTAREVLGRRMVDFSAIRWEARTLDPADSVALHLQTRRWLEASLARPHDGPTVVVTHHLPTIHSVAPAFVTAVSNAAFASDLDDLFGPVSLWIHGHTHHSFDYRRGSTRIVANPRGYPMRDGRLENPAFDPGLVVEVPAPHAGDSVAALR